MPKEACRVKLTKRIIDDKKEPLSGEQLFCDSEVPGLILRVRGGRKYFLIRKCVGGRVWRKGLGHYGVLTLDQARAAAREFLADVVKGQARPRLRRVLTFGELADQYLKWHEERKRSLKNDVSVLRKHLGGWRQLKLWAIKRQDVEDLHAQIGKEHQVWANRVVAQVRSMFNWATRKNLYHGENPASGVEFFKEYSRTRFLRVDEMARFLRALREEPDPYCRTALMMLMLTGARRSEVLSAKWSDVDFSMGQWTIPQTKQGREHILPLTRELLMILKQLPQVQDNPYVFPSRHWGKHLTELRRPFHTICRKAGLENLRLHDLRRTVGSWLAGSGVSLHMIGKILGHSQPATTQVYARLDLEPLRLTLEANAERVLALLEGPRVQPGPKS